ncbi:hypothetical protein B0H15DRAFT_955092 [Mycena belliarum]|uniref:Uncharacterized protein n=1 Tax=Mycena belliarum TaxID=1033014 RepID=A0AAD6TS35_9AGAR|nr:hypothetical protein B0H15DRAFT_955092 [Mycena belliae]
MAICAAEIVAYMTHPAKVNNPGISIQVRNLVEWTWGLGYNHLDKHLSEFDDPLCVFTDNSLIVIPDQDVIRELHRSTCGLMPGVRRPHIRKVYKGRTSFEYLVIPVDSWNPLPGRLVLSEVPPHIAVATTYGKIMQQWGYLAGEANAAVRTSLVERSNIALGAGSSLSIHDLNFMRNVYKTWSLVDYVPASFLSDDSDETMIEVEDSPDTKSVPSVSNNKIAWEVGTSASCDHEPRRRLLPHELEQDINDQPPTDGDDEDDYASSVDEPVDPDNEGDLRWLESITSWVEGTKATRDEGMLLNDGQIQEDPREKPRAATTVDLDKPDYLCRRTTRTA